MQEYLRRLLKDKARLRKWKRIMIALSCIVVVCTVYALSLPAQTMACDKEEHTHTAECYDENNQLICDKEEHTHTDDCNKQEEVNEQEEVVKDEPETQNNEEQVSQESEEVTTTTETTSQPYDLSLHTENIESIDVYYRDANEKWQNLNEGNVAPGFTDIYLKVNFNSISTKDLLEQHNGILVYSLPNFMRDFEKAGNGNLLAGEKIIGKIDIANNKVKISLDKTYLNELVTNSNNQLNGSFYVKGQIDLTEINKNNGQATLVVGKKTVTLNYGPDCIEKFGSVDMKKEMSNVDKVNNYLTYTVTVTAGKDGCKDLYVVDKFTSNANLVSYAGNISSTETTLTSEDNNKDPFETIISGATHGKIYKASIPDATTKIPDAGVSDITNPCIVWHIGDMKPNESRTLTYYVKLNDKANLSGQTIKNNASLYSKSSKDIYEKKVDDKNRNAEFTPKIDYSNQFTKTVDGNITRNADGSYTIPFKSSISIKKDTSNYTIKNLQFYDYLKHDLNMEINADLLQYIHFDQNTFKLYKNNSVVDPNKYNIKWSTDNTNFKEWNDKDNFRSFILSGNENTPIDLSPGESCYITYSVTVKPEAFAKLHTDSIRAFNRFIAHADNVNKRNDFADGFEAWNSISNIKTYEWNGKQVDPNATTSSKTETMNEDRFVYTGSEIIKDSSSSTTFTIPEGSYKYTVETNKTLNDFNVNEVTMTDTLTSKHMKYVGYMKVEALEADSISRDLNKGTNDTYTLNSNYTPVDTKWIKIDDQQSFSLKPSALGWTDKNYAYRFTYYAKPDNLDAFTETKVKNKFTLEGVVKKGTGEFTFNKEDVSKETTLTIKGNLNLNANKQSWYYKEPDSNTWTNGELYWVVDIGGAQINKGMVFRDLIKTGDGITESILRDGSLVGIYKGTLPDGKKISDYKDIEDLTKKSGLTSIDNEFTSQLNGTNELLLTANVDIKLDTEKVYVIIKSEPSELPSPTNNRDYKTFKNSIYIKEDGEYVSENVAEKTLYTSPEILKELGQVFKYDGKIVTTLQKGADKKNNGEADPSKIDTNLLNKSRGVFISWAFKVNYDGQLSGDYDVIDDIPNGMEFSYMRVKWHGDEYDASQVKSKTIDNPGSGWEFRENNSTNDNGNSEHTIYYVSKDKKQTMIRLGEFVSKSIRDNNSVDVQVVCRVTNPQVLLGAQPSDFTNKVTLQKDGRDIATSSSQIPFKLDDTDKNIDKEIAKKNGQKLEFEINTNQLGQTLPTNDNGGLTLVDKLGKNLKLDTTSVKIYKNNNEEVTGCVIAYQDNILEISNIPNDIPIKIKYTATVNAKPGDSVNIANTAYWKGYSENGGDTVQQNYSYSVSGTIGASSVVNFKLTKQDQNNLSKVLVGAIFTIEKCEFDKDGNMTTSDIGTVTTDEKGIITKQLQYDTLYKITETQAPDGYVLNDKPIYILDVKKGNESYVDTVKQYLKNINLEVSYQAENFDIQVRNHKGEITVVKKFINDAAGKSTKPVSGIYRFGLYDDPNKLETPLQTKSIIYNVGDTQDKSVKFENLDLNKTYYVYELGDQDKPITDTSKEVTINTMNYQVVYKNETQNTDTSSAQNGDTVTVTNKSRTKILPSTGSMGTLIYRLLGTMLVIVSVICLSNINKNNRKGNRRKK